MPLAVKIKIRRFIKGLYVRVKTRDPKLKFMIKELNATHSAITFKFEREPGQTVNVKDYFRQTHNINLRYPDLPLVQITKTAWIPMEICDIVAGSTFFGRLSPAQISEMLKSRFVTLSPKLKRQAIELGLNQISINSPYHKGWQIKVNPDFMQVGARVLPPPQLIYKRQGKDQTVPTLDGTWKTNGLQAWRAGGKINRWVVIVFDADQPAKPPKWEGFPMDKVVDCLRGFVKACKEFGIVFAQDKPGAIHHAGDTQAVKEAVIAAAKRAGYAPSTPPDLVVTFSHGSRQYDQIKRVCDVQLGVPSQNLFIGKAGGDRAGYWQNVALKVNVKLKNGVNQAINGGLPGFKQQPTILIGADVTHPKPSSFVPSIACVVASFDPFGTQYTCISHVQDSKQEIIGDLQNTMAKHLKTFFVKNNKMKPARIIFYRDGVSEGQFEEVMAKEVGAIRSACQALDASYKPGITYIICGKRHNYRDAEADRSLNARAGTVIDTAIVHPSFDDYYLLSHAGLIGTSKPCHYTILIDDNNMGKDAIQTLTFQLAHLMPRATRSISMAAPAQYAHLSCDRVRKHIGQADDQSDQMTASGLDDDAKRANLLEAAKKVHAQVHDKIHDTMYFM